MINQYLRGGFVVELPEDEANHIKNYVDNWLSELDLYQVAHKHLLSIENGFLRSGWWTTKYIDEVKLNNHFKLKLVFEVDKFKREYHGVWNDEKRFSYQHHFFITGFIEGKRLGLDEPEKIYKFEIDFKIGWKNEEDLNQMLEQHSESFIKTYISGLLSPNNEL